MITRIPTKNEHDYRQKEKVTESSTNSTESIQYYPTVTALATDNNKEIINRLMNIKTDEKLVLVDELIKEKHHMITTVQAFKIAMENLIKEKVEKNKDSIDNITNSNEINQKVMEFTNKIHEAYGKKSIFLLKQVNMSLENTKLGKYLDNPNKRFRVNDNDYNDNTKKPKGNQLDTEDTIMSENPDLTNALIGKNSINNDPVNSFIDILSNSIENVVLPPETQIYLYKIFTQNDNVECSGWFTPEDFWEMTIKGLKTVNSIILYIEKFFNNMSNLASIKNKVTSRTALHMLRGVSRNVDKSLQAFKTYENVFEQLNQLGFEDDSFYTLYHEMGSQLPTCLKITEENLDLFRFLVKDLGVAPKAMSNMLEGSGSRFWMIINKLKDNKDKLKEISELGIDLNQAFLNLNNRSQYNNTGLAYTIVNRMRKFEQFVNNIDIFEYLIKKLEWTSNNFNGRMSLELLTSKDIGKYSKLEEDTEEMDITTVEEVDDLPESSAGQPIITLTNHDLNIMGNEQVKLFINKVSQKNKKIVLSPQTETHLSVIFTKNADIKGSGLFDSEKFYLITETIQSTKAMTKFIEDFLDKMDNLTVLSDRFGLQLTVNMLRGAGQSVGKSLISFKTYENVFDQLEEIGFGADSFSNLYSSTKSGLEDALKTTLDNLDIFRFLVKDLRVTPEAISTMFRTIGSNFTTIIATLKDRKSKLQAISELGIDLDKAFSKLNHQRLYTRSSVAYTADNRIKNFKKFTDNIKTFKYLIKNLNWDLDYLNNQMDLDLLISNDTKKYQAGVASRKN